MRKSILLWTGVVLAVLLGVSSESGSQGRRFLVNKLAVRQVEMGYRLGEPSFKIRLHLESGQAIEQELSQGTDVDYFMALAHIMGNRSGRMFAEIVDDELVSVQIAVP